MARIGRPPLGRRAMTGAERQQRYQQKRDYEQGLTEDKLRALQRRQSQIKEFVGRQRRAARQGRAQAQAQAEANAQAAGLRWRLDQTDFRRWSPPPNARLILTDPPYDAGALDLYRDLPRYADDWLAAEGWLAIMTGQRHLPEILNALASGPLEYVWTVAFAQSSSRSNGIQFIRFQNIWKPVIILRKGKPTLNEWTGDLISYEWQQSARSAMAHKWQQETSPLEKLIKVMTEAGDLVLDPCCGSGTSGVAALRTGRHFAGCDNDPAAIEAATRRLQQQQAVRRPIRLTRPTR
jgi:16S rRNA G966 N2-methylase RsmD